MLPIRKIAPTEVALTTYYGKNFVTRGKKKANNYIAWLIAKINKAALSNDTYITRVSPGDHFDNNFQSPYIYGALAENFTSITAGDSTLYFDHTTRHHLVEPSLLTKLEVNGTVIVGLTNTKDPIVVDTNNIFHIYSPTTVDGVNKDWHKIGNIYQLLKLPEIDAPIDYTEVRIFSKTVPVGVVLSYFLGFKNMLQFIKAKYRTVEGRKLKGLTEHEFAIQFKDITFIFSREDERISLIVGGFLAYEKSIKLYEVEVFNHKDVYLNLLANQGLSSLYIRELELTDQMFVDSISKEILESMGMPVTFRGLLVKASEMLMTFHHPDSQDTAHMRIRGYERIAGAVYTELVKSVRAFKNRNIAGKSKIEMSPYAVWTNLMGDQSKKIPEDTNPIQNLKEMEAVTFTGEGGRSKDSLKNKESRAYHPNDVGIISESTVDSSDVGINTFLSQNPNFKNLRGLVNRTEKKDVNASNLLSTSVALAPCSDNDDKVYYSK